MISDYDGPANSSDIFKYLVGETVRAAFRDKDGRAVLVLSSGEAFVVGGPANSITVWWRLSASDVNALVAARREQINARIGELRDMDGVFP